MTEQQVIEKVIDIIVEASETEEDVTVDTSLIDDIGLSSMESILILGDIENEFGIDLPITGLRRVRTVGDLCQHVIEKLKA
ncbi:MAG: acyl carrier protein [Lachnospiraceae bacterium]|nr:acyl carrier protein [Lachnospiraceae bacterium]